MNSRHIIFLLLMFFFFFSDRSFSSELPPPSDGTGVEICKNDDATDCTTLDYDVDDLYDLDFEDKISFISVGPYTSVVLYEDKYFDEVDDEGEDGYIIPATSAGDTLDKEELESLGLHDNISSIKVHPRGFFECEPGDVDDCLMEMAKPIIVYDEGSPDCNDRFREGEDGFQSGVRTVNDKYKVVFYDIYHKQDCGADIPGIDTDAIYDIVEAFGVDLSTETDAHEGDQGIAEFAFQKIEENGETYWALVASRSSHHHSKSDRELEEMLWPLRLYLSENKHGQYASYWECEEWGVNDAIASLQGEWERIEDETSWIDYWLPIFGWIVYEYEDCDYWPRSFDGVGSDGGEILNPEEYGLVEGSFPDSDEWFDTITISLDEAGLVVLEPDVPVEVNPSWGFEPEHVYYDGEWDMLGSSSDYNATSYYLQSGSWLTVSSDDSITASNFIVESGASATFIYGTDSDDSVVLSPFFWVERGAEFHVYAGGYIPFKY